MKVPRARKAHIFARDKHDHYVEPNWVSERLFDVESFESPVHDPACGWGRILRAADARGYATSGGDVVDRKRRNNVAPNAAFRVEDFLTCRGLHDSIACNPPFGLIPEFIQRSLDVVRGVGKVAILCPIRRLPAMRWMRETPLARVWLLTPRPSMPTGSHILQGGYVGGGTADFCWLVFDALSLEGEGDGPMIRWLHRDGD
jgi:hypothetical protein